MKKIRFVVGIAAAALVLLLIAGWLLINPNRYRDVIQTQLENQLGRRVTLGEMSLGFFPLRFQVNTPLIAEAEGVGSQPFIRAEKLDVRVSLLPLLGGNIRVDSLELQRPSVEFIRTTDGTWNFSTLGSKTETSAQAPASTGGSQISLARLVIHDGEVGITDLQAKKPRTGYDHIDLTVLNYAPGKAFTYDLAAHVQGQEKQLIRLAGEAGPVSPNDPAATPFQGKLTLDQVQVAALMKFMDTGSTNIEGILSGESDVANQSGSTSVAGQLKLDGARINNLDVGYPISAKYNLSYRTSEDVVAIDDATLSLGQTPLSVTGTMALTDPQPTIDLRIKSGDVSIAEIARLASAFGVAFAPGTNVTGQLSADVQAKGSTAKPQLSGAVRGRNLNVSGAGIPQAVQISTIDLDLTPSVIRSNEFNAVSGKTTVVSQFALSKYSSPSPAIDVRLRSPQATLPEILSIAKAYGMTGLEQIQGDGSLNFDMRANGPIETLSGASVAKAINGNLNLDFSPLHIAGFDAAHELGVLGGFASKVSDQTATDILHIVGHILIKDGIAQTNDLQAQLKIGTLNAAGSADLATEALNLKLSAIFSKAFSDQVTSNRAGGFLNTAFSNSAGELVLPAIVTGPFTKPKFDPDLKAVAQMQKQKFVPSLSNPGEAISNVLGVIGGKKDTGGETQLTEPATTPKPSGLKGILGGVFGKKPEQSK
jgi:uncharacterized protein involved in outer membrane biogenesis